MNEMIITKDSENGNNGGSTSFFFFFASLRLTHLREFESQTQPWPPPHSYMARKSHSAQYSYS